MQMSEPVEYGVKIVG